MYGYTFGPLDPAIRADTLGVVRTLRVVTESSEFDSPSWVTGTITLDENADMVFSDRTDMALIGRFYRLRSVEVNQTDRQVFDPQYDGGGYSNGYVSVVTRAFAAVLELAEALTGVEAVAIEVWNAANELGANFDTPSVHPRGLAQLAAFLGFHNAVMSGGLAFALDAYDKGRNEAAARACEYLELNDVAEVIRRADNIDRDADLPQSLEQEYYVKTGETGVAGSLVEAAFERMFALAPQDFSQPPLAL